jgi:hypothetical protein
MMTYSSQSLEVAYLVNMLQLLLWESMILEVFAPLPLSSTVEVGQVKTVTQLLHLASCPWHWWQSLVPQCAWIQPED